VGLRANAKAGIWGVFMTMGPQKFPPPISENFGEFNDWKRGASSGIFGKFPGRGDKTPTFKKGKKHLLFLYTYINNCFSLFMSGFMNL